jgi:hypothetical protein
MGRVKYTKFLGEQFWGKIYSTIFNIENICSDGKCDYQIEQEKRR